MPTTPKRQFKPTPKDGVLDALSLAARESCLTPTDFVTFLFRQDANYREIRVFLSFSEGEAIPKYAWDCSEGIHKPIPLKAIEPCTIVEFWTEFRDNTNPKCGISPAAKRAKTTFFSVRFNDIVSREIVRAFSADDLLARLHFDY